MACPLCGSIFFASKTHVLVTDNVCRTCFSEWVEVLDDDGYHTTPRITKSTRTDEGAPPAPGRS
jgi:hypothetical protein